jgi:hypothetical protein
MGTDIHGIMQAKIDGVWQDVPHNYEGSRHYMLFAWLGNVRNGFGFAGCATHNPIKPLSDNRGLPDNFTEGYWVGDHSYSYVTGDEVLKADLPTTIRSGVVPREVFTGWDGVTQPEAWSGGVSGPGVVVSPPDEVTPATTHVQISWEVSLREEFAYFIDEIQRLTDEYGEVRFVFGFDS